MLLSREDSFKIKLRLSQCMGHPVVNILGHPVVTYDRNDNNYDSRLCLSVILSLSIHRGAA